MDFVVDPKNEGGPSHEMQTRTVADAYHWLLHVWAPQAGLRPQDRLFLRFPLNFVSPQLADWSNPKKPFLLAALAARAKHAHGYQVGLYMPFPSADYPPVQLAADLWAYARHCEAGIELDASFRERDGRILMAAALQAWRPSQATPPRQVRIEPVWDRSNPITHTMDAVATEEYVRSKQNSDTWWMPPPGPDQPRLHIWFHRAYAPGTESAVIRDEMRQFCHDVRQAGHVPRLPLSLVIYMGMRAADFEPDDGTQGTGVGEIRQVPAKLVHPWKSSGAVQPHPVAQDATAGAAADSPASAEVSGRDAPGAIPDALPAPAKPVRATRLQLPDATEPNPGKA